MANKNTIPSSSNHLSSSSKNHSSWLGLADSHGLATPPQLHFSNNESGTREGDGGKEMPMKDRDFSRASLSSSMIDDITNNISQNPLLKANPIPFPKQPMSDSYHPTLISVSSQSQLPHENETTILTINPSLGLCLQQIKTPVIATTVATNQVSNVNSNGDLASADCQIRSVPYKKNGPYTCPRCNRVFPTSQSFAAHASSHYKDETKDEKEKRMSSKIRKRNHRPQMVNNELTVVPVSSQDQAAAGGVARTIARAEVDQDQAALPSTAHVEGVKVKSEPEDV